MNRFFIAIATAIGITSSIMAIKATAAGPVLSHPYEWTVQINTQELQHQFQYNTSSISQVVKASLEYYEMDDQDHKTKYEDLWYSNAKALGMERHHKLELKQGDWVAIKVKHKNGYAPLDEQRAAGKAVMKAVLEIVRNKNMVATIKVPASSFHTISSEIQNYHFSPVSESGSETPIESDMNLFLESEPEGSRQAFVHYN